MLYRARFEFKIKVNDEYLTFIRYRTARSESAIEDLAHQIAKDIMHEYKVNAIDYVIDLIQKGDDCNGKND